MMFALCPQCGVELGVDVPTLSRGHGQVECPACEMRFNALPLLGQAPFFVLNADTFWIDRDGSNLRRL
ncbi:MAG TPA: hypothetical protein PKZ76_11875, partial [Xanthomonadaceae bacterium]|nr:hypothetical protein [Xanthomonadaceae bacterium]